IHGRRRGLLAFPFWLIEFVFPPLAWFRPPFSEMSREEQRWMLRRYILRPSYERARAAVPGLADFMYQIGDIAHAFLALAHFTGQQGQSQVGYVPPDARGRLQPEITGDRPPDGSEFAKLPADNQDPAWTRPPNAPAKRSLLAPGI